MLQALATLIFAAAALLACGTIALMIGTHWQAIARALGMIVDPAPAPLPPHYRVMPAPQRRVSAATVRVMTIGQAPGWRAAA